jgi:exonuclease SbcD
MSYRPFRFLHTSDLHLDIPASGMAQIPGHLRRTMLDAAHRSLVRLVDTALAENVDFVVLAGDVIQADQAGPRGLFQFREQLERMAEANLQVYWASGDIDAAMQWPSAIELPENVHRFLSGPATHLTHQRDGRPLAELIGSGQKRKKNIQPKDYLDKLAAVPTVVLAHGTIDARKAEKQLAQQSTPSYWALGSQHTRDTLLSSTQTIHYSGTHQGRNPSEDGPHGVTLVEFDQDGAFHTSFVETDVLRWSDESFEVDQHSTLDQLEQNIRTRFDTLMESHLSPVQVVACSITGEGSLLNDLRSGSLAADLTELLQADYGHRDTPLWTSSLRVVASSAQPSVQALSQSTILGDFLQTISAFESGQQSLQYGSLLPDKKQLAQLSADFDLSEPGDISAVLEAARSRGIELLSGDPPNETAAVTAAGGTQR